MSGSPGADDTSVATALGSERARGLIKVFGVTYGAVLVMYMLASPFLAAVAPFGAVRLAGGAEGLGIPMSQIPLPESVLAALRGKSFLATPRGFTTVYGSLLIAATLLWMSALMAVRKYQEAITPAHVSSVLRWSMAFTVCLFLATPVLVQDLWLSVAWGRVVAAGSNPYYVAPTALADLPVGEAPGLMTYGPLWALISGASAALSGGSGLIAASLLKVVIAGAWAASVRAVWALTRMQPPATRCTALILFGWSPLGLTQGVGDGHNDVVLVLPMLLWLLWSERGAPVRSALALAASVTIKYVTAPLFALHLARALVERRAHPRAHPRALLLAITVAPALVLGLMAVFYRSPDFFAADRALQDFRFFTPSAVVEGLARWIGIGLGKIPRLLDLAFPAAATVAAWRWIRRPSETAFRSAALWMMCAVLFGVVGHVWPWFVLWVLALASIQPLTRLSWFVAGLTAAAPFALLPWTVAPELNPMWRIGAPELMLYAAAIGGMLLGDRVIVRTGRRSVLRDTVGGRTARG